MLWRLKKQVGHVAVSSQGFSLGADPEKSLAAVAPDAAANHDIAEPLPIEPLAATRNPSTVAAHSAGPLPRLDRSENAYVVPRGYRISGAMISHRPIVIEGELHGRGLSAAEVVVERSGVLRAPADVKSLRVFGRVVSAVRATTLVEVLPGGEVQGDLESPACSISPGGRISGGTLRIGVVEE